MQKQVALSGATSLPDVAGGSGAFSITLCNRFPRLRATILDFPTVAPLAERFIADAKLSDRIRFIAGDALRG